MMMMMMMMMLVGVIASDANYREGGDDRYECCAVDTDCWRLGSHPVSNCTASEIARKKVEAGSHASVRAQYGSTPP